MAILKTPGLDSTGFDAQIDSRRDVFNRLQMTSYRHRAVENCCDAAEVSQASFWCCEEQSGKMNMLLNRSDATAMRF